ncbi:hypothetical protein [Sphingorhabdus pulchriflava]|uniref:hypothetical protein n=1 Tax=Sphingorhabdus pulchriflava TaxID=2292257 RepID=UPI0015F1723A|nr:hypothetical protein [Sphingorhabdus pulchriflava]
MTPAQQAHVDAILQGQPRLGNRAISRIVGRGVTDGAVGKRRKALGIPSNGWKGRA